MNKYTVSSGLLFIVLGTIGIGCFMKKIQAQPGCALSSVEDIKRLFTDDTIEIQDRFQMIKKHIGTTVDELLAIPAEKRTFVNTIKKLDDINRFTEIHGGPLLAEAYVNPEKKVRDTAQQEYLGLAAYLQEDVFKNVKVYQACKAYVDGNYQQEKDSLNDEERKYIKELMHDFKRSGLDLEPKKLEELKNILNEINRLSMEYEKNIAEENKKFYVSKDALDGLSEEFISTLNKDKNGKYELGTDYPTYHAIMKQGAVESTRKKMFHLFNNRAYPKNMSVLSDVIKQRDDLAKLLGYESYAAYELDDLMVKKPERAFEFLNKLIPEAEEKQRKEFKELVGELPKGVSLSDNGKIKPWDTSYIKEQFKQKHYNLDEEVVSEYFPVDHALSEIFDIYQKLLGLRFEQSTITGLWEPSLRLIKVYKKTSNTLLGFLILDLLPREGKYTHACHVSLVPAQLLDGKICPSLSMVIANFPKPSNGHQGLLKFDDVKTFFHEFGHAMHAILGSTQMSAFSGTSVKRDFVEAPSQMFEEWFHDKELLKKLSSHYKTHQPLPDNMIDTLINMNKFDAGDFILTQTFYSLMSLDFFGPGGDKNTEEIVEKLYKKILPYKEWDPMYHMQAAFGHLMGYGAGYYGYLWSRVYALDMFDHIKEKGLLSEKAGQELIDSILGSGGSQEPDVLLHKFLGREPIQEAFLKTYGLK